MPQTFDTASVFTIEQLTGLRRKVSWTGRGLPYRPFSLKTKQRVELTWLPGNPVATATVLGPQEDPTAINGYWKDKYIGDAQGNPAAPFVADGAPVTSCRDAVQLMDAIVREGQLVQVTWDIESRQGFLVEFDKNWHNVHDLEWSMNFTWIGRGEPQQPAVFAQDSLSNLTSQLTADFDEQNNKFGDPGFPFALSPLNAFIGAMAQIEAAVNTVQRSLSNMAALALAPTSAINSAVASCAGLIVLCDNLSNLLLAQPPGRLNYAVPIGVQDSATRLTTQLWVYDMLTLNSVLRYDAVDQMQVLLTLTSNDILAVYTAKNEDDLRDVSRIYYGTPFDWIALQQFNSLRTSQLTAGQVVLIPRSPQAGLGT